MGLSQLMYKVEGPVEDVLIYDKDASLRCSRDESKPV